MVTLEMVNSLRTVADLLEQRRITTHQVSRYAEVWLTIPGWTPEQEAHITVLMAEYGREPVAMATLNFLAAEITYQHAKHVLETVTKWQ